MSFLLLRGYSRPFMGPSLTYTIPILQESSILIWMKLSFTYIPQDQLVSLSPFHNGIALFYRVAKAVSPPFRID